MTWAIRERAIRSGAPAGWSAWIRRRIAIGNAGGRCRLRRLRELASQRRRFGYRRLGLLLEAPGHPPQPKKLYRLYKEERLTVRKRGGRKRATGTSADGDPAGPEPTLVPRLRHGHAGQRGASASSPSSMTSPENARAWSSTPRSPAGVSPVNSIASPNCAAIPA